MAEAGSGSTGKALKADQGGGSSHAPPRGARKKTELNTIDTTNPPTHAKIPGEHDVAPLDGAPHEAVEHDIDEQTAVDEPVGLDDLSALQDADPALDIGADPAAIEALVADDDIEAVTDDDIDVDAVPLEDDEEDEGLPPVSNRVAPRLPGHMPGVPNRPIMHARLPAKAEIFHEGDHVVYPTHGVGKVERIATEEIAGHKLELIHITFEENRMTLRVPVAKARSAGLRKLATRKMFDDAMAVLKGRARIKRTMWSRRAQEYEAKINSGDPIAIAEVVRDLHRNAGQPDQSFSERQIYEAAMDRLAAELAALDKTDKPTAVTKLGDFLKTG
jgi:CarD family transcriptional regulator